MCLPHVHLMWCDRNVPLLLLQACLSCSCALHLQTYTDSSDNVWVKRGELHITALQPDRGNAYTSGRIQTRDSFYPGMRVGHIVCLRGNEAGCGAMARAWHCGSSLPPVLDVMAKMPDAWHAARPVGPLYATFWPQPLPCPAAGGWHCGGNTACRSAHPSGGAQPGSAVPAVDAAARWQVRLRLAGLWRGVCVGGWVGGGWHGSPNLLGRLPGRAAAQRAMWAVCCVLARAGQGVASGHEGHVAALRCSRTMPDIICSNKCSPLSLTHCRLTSWE